MSENGTGKVKWTLVSAVIAAAGLLFGGGTLTGWIASIKADAVFHDRVEKDMQDGVKRQQMLDQLMAKESELHEAVTANNLQIGNLQDLVHELVAAQSRQTDKIDLLVQSQMREGKIAR